MGRFEIGDVVYVKVHESLRMIGDLAPDNMFREPHDGAKLGIVSGITPKAEYWVVFPSIGVLPHLRHAAKALNQNIAARVEAEVPKPEPTKAQSTEPTKAVRSADADHVRYDLITPIGLQRLAMRYALGSMKYGDYNWTKGFPFSSLLNHVERHLKAYTLGDRSEDHLAGAAWGIFTMMHFETTDPNLNDLKRYCEDGLAVFNQLEAQFPHTKAGN